MHRWLLALIAIAFLAYTAATAFTRVEPGERAIVRRFGRILPDKPGPGLHVGIPWGIDEVERIKVARVRRVVIGYLDRAGDEGVGTPAGQLLTGDHNLVNVQAEIHYAIHEPAVDKFYLQFDRVPELVARAAEAVLAEWIAGRNVDEVLLRGKALLPAVLVAAVQARVAAYDLGVTIEDASITRLNPPDEVRDSFERVAQAQTAIVTQRNVAHESAGRKEREAQAECFRLESLTAAYAQEQRLQAQADAESFGKRLAQYQALTRENPAYLNALWLDEMTRLYARMREAGRIDLLDHHLTGEGLSIVQFPPLPKKNR